MTPKEKAQELVDKYRTTIRKADVYGNLASEDEIYLAKECALIAVDEILSMGIMSDSGHFRMAKSYWEEVKQEIENL